MPITIYKSNRLELLAAALAENMRHKPLPPLEPETIVVQSRGMARWLVMELAGILGVAANISCPFPTAFVIDIFQKIFPVVTAPSFQKETAVWHIMRLLPSLVHRPGFKVVRSYLADGGNLKRLQLAARISDLFDQYTVYRPDMILDWDKGHDDGWQAQLWRELGCYFTGPHRAALQRDCLQRLRSADHDAIDLPRRVAVFGISTLPPYHVQILDGLGGHIEVNLYLLNPCQEYWGDIVSDREMARLTRARGRSDQELLLAKGNTILAGCGLLGRDFFEMLQDVGGVEKELFAAPGEATLLTAIQSDILHLEEPVLTGASTASRACAAGDRSIAIHSCHSPMREVEVLRDQLLNIFELYPELLPKDIVVMAPDIEQYSPLIQAVFDRPVNGEQRIPYSIADRSLRKDSGLFDLFLAVLGLARSRYGVNQVRDIIGMPLIYAKFGLRPDDLDIIGKWLEDTRVRWALDGADRKKLGLPFFSENSWLAGIERLLIGYAMMGGGESLYDGILPYDDMEGSDSQVLGCFLDCLITLFNRVKSFEQPRSLREWGGILHATLDELFAADQVADHELILLRELFTNIADQEKSTGFQERLGVEEIRSYLTTILDRETSPVGFLSGGVTFCAMLPMRAVPFKVVCLLGMNDKDYPRPDKSMSFNLMTKTFRSGDRSRRLDDRYIFLEALLAARKQLYISYVGQSLADNSELPPSVLVSDLLDYIRRNFDCGRNASLGDIVIRHPLQPFNPAYFKTSGPLFSYSSENCQAAAMLGRPPKPVPPLVGDPLAEPPDEWRTISVDQFLRFWRHPVRAFCRQRLGIVVPATQEQYEEKEVFALEGLGRYRLESLLLEKYLAGQEPESYQDVFAAAGALPPGAPGRVAFMTLCREVRNSGGRIRSYMESGPLPAVDIDCHLAGFALQGRLEHVFQGALVRFQGSAVKGRDLLAVWVEHLLLNHCTDQSLPRTSVLGGRDKLFVFQPVADAGKVLSSLLNLHWQGLCSPLRFFPQSSYAYTDAISRGKEEAVAMLDAERRWAGSEAADARGEGDDFYYKFCFRDMPSSSLGQEFIDLSEKVYAPLLAHLTEGKQS